MAAALQFPSPACPAPFELHLPRTTPTTRAWDVVLHDGPPALFGDATESLGDSTPGEVVGPVYHLAECWIEPVPQILVGNPSPTELRLEVQQEYTWQPVRTTCPGYSCPSVASNSPARPSTTSCAWPAGTPNWAASGSTCCDTAVATTWLPGHRSQDDAGLPLGHRDPKHTAHYEGCRASFRGALEIAQFRHFGRQIIGRPLGTVLCRLDLPGPRIGPASRGRGMAVSRRERVAPSRPVAPGRSVKDWPGGYLISSAFQSDTVLG